MSLALAIALLLSLAAVAASIRHVLRWRRLAAGSRPASWRMFAILFLQFGVAALLFATLLPPVGTHDPSRLVVMTADADPAAAREAAGGGAILVALPEADTDAASAAGARAMPDLATALRLHPQAGALHVLGAGLEARDIPVARTLPVRFDPPPLAPGLVELHAPARVASGGLLRVSGRVHDAACVRVELLDPAGTVQDRAIPGNDGRFRLQAPIRTSGPAIHRLRLRGPVEAAEDLAVDATPGDGLRLLLLAGAPNPELKYLRRWAGDAGLQLRSRMALGGGVSLGDGPLALDAEALAGTDLLIVDERAWTALGATTRGAVLAAVDEGLGLMLRITSPPDASTRDALSQLGFALGAADPALDAAVVLDAPHATAPDPANPVDGGNPASPAGPDVVDGLPELARQPHALLGAGSVSLLDDATGASLARWRLAGRGRIAIWNLDQSFRLVLAGHAQRHARLWSEAAGTIARPGGRHPPRFEGIARAGARATLCGLDPGTVLLGPDGARMHPQADPAAGGCAAVWPQREGWYRAGDTDAARMLYVHAADALPGIAARERRDATLLLSGAGVGAGDHAGQPGAFAGGGTATDDAALPGSVAPPSGSRWPWFLAWLIAAGALWWLERGGRR